MAEMKTKPAQPVEVKIISPKNGEKVRGQITIEAVVNNPTSVHHLDFYFREPGAKDRYSWKDYAPRYFWGGDGQTVDTTLFADGPASVVAFCHVNGIKKPVSEHRVHFIIDNGKPIVRIVEPKNEGEVLGETVVRVSARDPKGIRRKEGLTAVYVYLDGTKVAKLTKEPFEVPLNTCLMAPGRHSIQAVAEDSERLTSAHTVMLDAISH